MAIVYDEEEFFEEGDSFDTDPVYDVNIKVFGVGGGGCNALEHMAIKGVNSVEYVAINTDVAALKSKDRELMKRVQIGRKVTRGRGAGGRPEVGGESAREDKDQIEKVLKDASMVFISAGMGGGTGTGAAPIIAEIAQNMGILTVGVVTKPFDFEREQKMNQALKGIAEMRKHVDALVIIPNQKLLKLNEKNISCKQAFELVDDVLFKAVKSISELVSNTAVMNIDFADLKATLEHAGDAHIAIGVGSGENKAEEAVNQIVNSPLLETSINNAGKVLVNIVMSEDTLLQEVDDVMNRITSAARPDVEVIHGVDYSDDLKDSMIVTIIATSFGEKDANIAAKTAPAEDKSAEKEDNTIKTTTSGSLGDYISRTLEVDTNDDDDSFGDLEKIFKSRR